MNKKIMAFIISLLLVFSFTGTAAASNSFPENEAQESIQEALDYFQDIQNKDGGFPCKEGRESNRDTTAWVIMAVRAAGEDPDGSSWSKAGNTPVDYLQDCTKSLESTNDCARILLALSAAGQGVTYNGINPADKIMSVQHENGHLGKLVNSHMWSILALASVSRDIPDSENARDWLLEQQQENSGFSWAPGGRSDVDDTSIALQALILLGQDRESAAVKDALDYIKDYQQENGGFSSGWFSSDPNASTDAWVLQGLLAAGENPVSEKWSVNNNDVISHILSLQSNKGYFNWKPGVKSSPVKVTACTVMALAGKPFPVNVNYDKFTSKSSNTSKFSDLSPGHWAYDPVMQLVNNNILSGYPGGVFKPGEPVSRAEFTKFMAYGLDLQGINSSAAGKFKDVPQDKWYYNVVSIAAQKGYVNGRSEDVFAPRGKITGGEMAAMLVRALPEEKQYEVKSGPYWYSASVRRAEKNGLLCPGFDAQANATRAQCAYSIVQLRDILGIK
ncbi:MAG: S-layer homology domain-containing protein [Clostridiales bacterium]|nr:S-layer homology domain-containing protein [Clostridiales bacterium]MCF8022924.1 S-layer homology domain-containing protein [Clostridiales bacterium]